MIFKRIILPLFILGLLVAGYFYLALRWSYSSGDRAGWIQKLSDKGWICKTWEGEMAQVSTPGSSVVEKFLFTVRDESVAKELSALMGKRVTLHYEEKVGLPGSCFGDTRYFVTKATETSDLSLTPGVTVKQSPSAVTVPPVAAPAAPASAP